MKTIYQLSWNENGSTKYAAFMDKGLAERVADQISEMYKSVKNTELVFEANEIGLFEDADDFIDALTKHMDVDSDSPDFSLN